MKGAHDRLRRHAKLRNDPTPLHRRQCAGAEVKACPFARPPPRANAVTPPIIGDVRCEHDSESQCRDPRKPPHPGASALLLHDRRQQYLAGSFAVYAAAMPMNAANENGPSAQTAVIYIRMPTEPDGGYMGVGGAIWRLAVAPWPAFLVELLINQIPVDAGDISAAAIHTLEKSIFAGLWLSLLSIFIGISLYPIFRKFGWTSWWHTVGGAVVIPPIGLIILQFWPEGRKGDDFSSHIQGCDTVIHNVTTSCGWGVFYQSLGWAALFGVSCGGTFWLLSLMRNGKPQ